jgi:hypothetical protein
MSRETSPNCETGKDRRLCGGGNNHRCAEGLLMRTHIPSGHEAWPNIMIAKNGTPMVMDFGPGRQPAITNKHHRYPERLARYVAPGDIRSIWRFSFDHSLGTVLTMVTENSGRRRQHV